MIEVVSFQDWRKENFPSDQVVVTVSKSATWSKGLSPFVLGPCPLYDDYVAKNVENAWQYSKVYPEHVDGDEITQRYWDWAETGWDNSYASRYPMGKGVVPLYSVWKRRGEIVKLPYVEARKTIYIPVYYNAVKDTEAFRKLKEVYDDLVAQGKDLYLVDFDAYRHKKENMSYYEVINNPNRKMGHAFVLAMMLECPDRLVLAMQSRAQ